MAEPALEIIKDQIAEAIRAPKCHRCDCFQKTVETLANTEGGQHELAPVLGEAKSVFTTLEYDCLGCPVCYPAIAANAFAEAYSETAAAPDSFPTEAPDERAGWPQLPGDYFVLRYRAPVTVCTLNNSELASKLAALSPTGLHCRDVAH